MAKETDQEKIREKAYELWELEGRPEGRHEDHWTAAKATLGTGKAKRAKPAAKSKPKTPAARPKRAAKAKTQG